MDTLLAKPPQPNEVSIAQARMNQITSKEISFSMGIIIIVKPINKIQTLLYTIRVKEK